MSKIIPQYKKNVILYVGCVPKKLVDFRFFVLGHKIDYEIFVNTRDKFLPSLSIADSVYVRGWYD